MTLDEIITEWEKDSKIDSVKLDQTSVETAKLHAKYLRLYANAKLKLKDAEFKQKILLKDKWLYYEGKMSKEDIQRKGWKVDPFEGLSLTTKTAKEQYYESDTDIQASEAKIVYQTVVIDTLKEIMDNLKWRHSHIKNIIEFRKFTEGI